MAVPTFTDTDIRDYLQKHHALDESRAKRIAYLCDGNLAEASRLLLDEQDDRTEWFAEWMRSCFKQELIKLVKLADTFDGMSKDRQKSTFDYALRVFRDMLVWTQGAGELLRMPEEELTFVQKFSKAIPPASLESMIQELNEAYYHTERNVRAKMVFLDLSLSMARLFQK